MYAFDLVCSNSAERDEGRIPCDPRKGDTTDRKRQRGAPLLPRLACCDGTQQSHLC